MTERKQFYHSSWQKKKAIVWCIVIAIIIASICVVFFQLLNKSQEYVHPAFEENAKPLNEKIIKDNDIVVTKTDNGFSFAITPNIKFNKDGTLTIFASNVVENNDYLQYIVSDANTDTVLFQSGVLKPNEYIKDLTPVENIESKDYDLIITVNAFESNTWYSKGKLSIKFKLNNTER